MLVSLSDLLSKLDYRISSNAFSRPQNQVRIIVNKLKKLSAQKLNAILDVGGGLEPQYKPLLVSLSKKYLNLEIKKGPQVNIVGSVYKIPLKASSIDLATLFMVLEHLNDPPRGLQEANRVLIKGGYLALTTVQYWHTHNHPHDYFRYTKQGLEYLCKKAGLKVVDIWSIGGPFLVVFHAIELNLPGAWRTIFSILFYRLFDWLDWIVFKHNDTRENSDSVGWALIAKKI
jgi:SAM-dependent methyltransferase